MQFSQKRELRAHVKSHDIHVEVVYQCGMCEAKFANVNELSQHYQIHWTADAVKSPQSTDAVLLS